LFPQDKGKVGVVRFPSGSNTPISPLFGVDGS
jgi:hypothetical protein